VSRLEGILPALESAHRHRLGSLKRGGASHEIILINLSGNVAKRRLEMIAALTGERSDDKPLGPDPELAAPAVQQVEEMMQIVRRRMKGDDKL